VGGLVWKAAAYRFFDTFVLIFPFYTVMFTEHGMAPVWGRHEREQAEGLIEFAAHPKVREELREEAHYLGLL